MKLKTIAFIVLLSFLIPGFSHGQGGFKDQDRIVAQLTEGVQRLKIDGTPGLINVFGEKAFTIVTDWAGRSLIAGATHGKGRIVVMTHGDWVAEKHISTADNNKLMGNIFLWATHENKRMKVFSREMNLTYKFNDIPALQFQKMSRFPDNLKQHDLILIDFTANSRPENFDGNTIEALRKFVADGGGIICFAMGWHYNAYGEGKAGKSLEKDFIGNIFLRDFGLLFSGDYTVKEFQLSQSVGNNNHPLQLVESVSDIIETKKTMSNDAVNKLLQQITVAKNRFPYSEKHLRKFEGYYDSFGKRRDISSKYPVLKTDVPFALTLAMLNALYQSAPYNRVSKMKDADIFPGTVGPDAVEIEKNLRFDLSKLRWQSTGLYAPAGRVVSITIDQSEKNTILARIGAHSDVLLPFDEKYRRQLQRGPDISMTRILEGGETLMTSPYGGLIYLEKVGKPGDKVIDVKIKGAVQAPYFKLQETGTREWRDKIRYYDVPWGELAGEHIIITFASETLRKIDDPEKLLRYWDKVVSYYHELQQEPPKNYQERFVHDVQPKIGWLHSGYPIVINLQVSDYTAGLAPLEKGKANDIYHAASWGHLHELGHNCQRPEWTFEGTTEVTVNLFTLYVTEKMDGTTPTQNQWHTKGWPILKKYVAKGSPFEEWKKDPMLALETYILMQKDFGWDAFKKVFAAYQKLTPGERPKNDQEKRDLWVIMFSDTVKRDLGPYYTKIGMPVSAIALKKVKKYPIWMPDNL